MKLLAKIFLFLSKNPLQAFLAGGQVLVAVYNPYTAGSNSLKWRIIGWGNPL